MRQLLKMGEPKELNKDYLINLLKELEDNTKDYIYGKRCKIPWFTAGYGIPMYNIKCKVQSFEPYFEEFGMKFPNLNNYPGGDFLTLTNSSNNSGEEVIYKGEKIRVKNNCIS